MKKHTKSQRGGAKASRRHVPEKTREEAKGKGFAHSSFRENLRRFNEQVLRRADPCVQELIHTCRHTCVYRLVFSDSPHWVRFDIEGSLFVVRRDRMPRYRLVVLNRRHQGNLVFDLTSKTNLEYRHPFVYLGRPGVAESQLSSQDDGESDEDGKKGLYGENEANESDAKRDPLVFAFWFADPVDCLSAWTILHSLCEKLNRGEEEYFSDPITREEKPSRREDLQGTNVQESASASRGLNPHSTGSHPSNRKLGLRLELCKKHQDDLSSSGSESEDELDEMEQTATEISHQLRSLLEISSPKDSLTRPFYSGDETNLSESEPFSPIESFPSKSLAVVESELQEDAEVADLLSRGDVSTALQKLLGLVQPSYSQSLREARLFEQTRGHAPPSNTNDLTKSFTESTPIARIVGTRTMPALTICANPPITSRPISTNSLCPSRPITTTLTSNQPVLSADRNVDSTTTTIPQPFRSISPETRIRQTAPPYFEPSAVSRATNMVPLSEPSDSDLASHISTPASSLSLRSSFRQWISLSLEDDEFCDWLMCTVRQSDRASMLEGFFEETSMSYLSSSPLISTDFPQREGESQKLEVCPTSSQSPSPRLLQSSPPSFPLSSPITESTLATLQPTSSSLPLSDSSLDVGITSSPSEGTTDVDPPLSTFDSLLALLDSPLPSTTIVSPKQVRRPKIISLSVKNPSGSSKTFKQ